MLRFLWISKAPKFERYVQDGEIELETGQTFVFDQLDEEGDNKRVYTTYKTMYQDVNEGDQILLDDGKMEVLVTAIEGSNVIQR